MSRFQQAIRSNPVVVCGEEYCPFVQKTKREFKANGIDFFYFTDMSDAERGEVRQASGKGSVPQVFVHGLCVGGCNDGAQPWQGAVKLLNQGKLQKAIAAANAEAARAVLVN